MINVVDGIDGSSKPFLYRGEDCMDVFIQKIIEIKNEIMDRMKENKEIIMNRNNWRDCNTATKCFICGKDFQQGDTKLETIVILQVDIGDVPTMIVIYGLLCVIAKSLFSFITIRTMTII